MRRYVSLPSSIVNPSREMGAAVEAVVEAEADGVVEAVVLEVVAVEAVAVEAVAVEAAVLEVVAGCRKPGGNGTVSSLALPAGCRANWERSNR